MSVAHKAGGAGHAAGAETPGPCVCTSTSVCTSTCVCPATGLQEVSMARRGRTPAPGQRMQEQPTAAGISADPAARLLC